MKQHDPKMDSAIPITIEIFFTPLLFRNRPIKIPTKNSASENAPNINPTISSEIYLF